MPYLQPFRFDNQVSRIGGVPSESVFARVSQFDYCCLVSAAYGLDHLRVLIDFVEGFLHI